MHTIPGISVHASHCVGDFQRRLHRHFAIRDAVDYASTWSAGTGGCAEPDRFGRLQAIGSGQVDWFLQAFI
jgi:hypothetical protein